VVRRSRWTLLDQGVLETQEEEAADAVSTGVEAEVALTEKAGDEVVMAVSVAEGTEERAAMAAVVAVDSAETVAGEAAASTEAEAGVAWMEETEVMVVVLIEGGVAMVAVVVVAVAMVAARLEDTREVAGVAVEGEASRMPMVSRSKPTKSVSSLRLVVVVSHLFSNLKTRHTLLTNKPHLPTTFETQPQKQSVA